MAISKSLEKEIGHGNLSVLPWSSFADVTEEVPEFADYQSAVRIYTKMLNDAQIEACLAAVTLPIRRWKWFIDPNGASDEVTQFVADNLNLPIEGEYDGLKRRAHGRFSHEKHLVHALQCLPHGHAYFEQLYDIRDGRAWLKKLAPRMPATIQEIQVATDGGLEYIRQWPSGRSDSAWTVPTLLGVQSPKIPVERLVAYVNDQVGGNWVGRSVLRSLYKNFTIKDRLLRVDAIKHERNGMGIPIVEAPEGATPAQLVTASALTQQYKVGDASGGSLPAGFKLRLVGTEGSIPDTLASIRYHDEQMARKFLAMFLQLGTTATGSRALGETFTDFFSLSQEAIARQYADTTNEHVIEDLVDLNWGEGEAAPLLKFAPDEDKRLSIAELATLVDKGLISVDEELEAFIRAERELPEKPANETPAVPAGGTATKPVAASQRPKMVRAAADQREPTDVEKATGVDFDAMRANFDDALEGLAAEWINSVKTTQVNELANAVAALEPDDYEGLAAIQATPAGRALLASAMADLALRAAEQARAEALSQGVVMAEVDISALVDGLDLRAAALDTLMAKSISEAAGRAALAEAGSSATSFDIATRVAEHLNSLTDTYVQDQLGGALMQAQNGARLAVFDEAGEGTFYASELSDGKQCSNCKAVDGKEYASAADVARDYPGGFYRDCQGGTRCRGTAVWVSSAESPASVE